MSLSFLKWYSFSSIKQQMNIKLSISIGKKKYVTQRHHMKAVAYTNVGGASKNVG